MPKFVKVFSVSSQGFVNRAHFRLQVLVEQGQLTVSPHQSEENLNGLDFAEALMWRT